MMYIYVHLFCCSEPKETANSERETEREREREDKDREGEREKDKERERERARDRCKSSLCLRVATVLNSYLLANLGP